MGNAHEGTGMVPSEKSGSGDNAVERDVKRGAPTHQQLNDHIKQEHEKTKSENAEAEEAPEQNPDGPTGHTPSGPTEEPAV